MLDKIRQLCAERHITFARLERECGLANATIRRWDNVSPNIENLIKVANYFGVSLDYLVGNGICALSAEAQQYAKQFDELPEEKKQLAMAYMGVVKAQ